MAPTDPQPFRYEGEVPPGDKRHVRYAISETYLGDPIEVPVTICNGAHGGPTVFLAAASHGDELNGVKVVQEVARRYDPQELHGTLVCLHVLNVPGYQAQTRYIPIYDLDLNRWFPGRPWGNMAQRMAHEIYHRFVAQCDVGIDFHTSTRNRTTMFHVRADMANEAVNELARAFGANLVLSGPGHEGSLRRTATADGIPTITAEMGRGQQYEEPLVERAVEGVESVLAEYGVLPETAVEWPDWLKVTPATQEEKTWLRADEGGLVEMQWGPSPIVREGETICTISDHFGREQHVVTAPHAGIVVGFSENPVAQPGHPLCHLLRIDDATREEIEAQIERGELDGDRMWGKKLTSTDEE